MRKRVKECETLSTVLQRSAPGLLIDLQWFAAEDEGRTEDPTDYKIRKAREEGRVAKSQDINAALVLLFPAGALIFLSSFFLEECMEILRFFFLRSTKADINSGMWFGIFVQYFLKLALPLALIAMLAGIIANVLQNNGFLFSTKPIQPQFNKIVPNFMRFFKRALFSVEGLFNFAKSLIKVVVLVFVSFLMIRANLPHFIELLSVSFPQAVFFYCGAWSKTACNGSLAAVNPCNSRLFFSAQAIYRFAQDDEAGNKRRIQGVGGRSPS